MPKLLILAVCEKVIIDRVGLPSAISIFQNMEIQLGDAPFPENAISPLKWAVFTLWQHTESDTGKEFTQITEIIAPDEKEFARAVTQYRVGSDLFDLQAKNQVDVLGVPIAKEGKVTVRVSLKDVPGTTGEYQFNIRHKRKETHAEPATGQPVN